MRESDAANRILDAALDHIAEQGLAALTLRTLAARVGVSVPTITHHLGAKGDVYKRLIGHAIGADKRFQERWAAREELLRGGDKHARINLIEHAFCAWIRSGRQRAILFCELVQSHSLPQQAQQAFAEWADDWRRFWIHMCGGAATGHALAAFFVDEAVYSLSLDGVEAYELLRSLCLARVVGGLAGSKDQREADLFVRLRHELAPPQSVVGNVLASSPGEKRADIARHAARLLVESGIEGVSHRSVAAAAEAPPSTVVYHFGSRDELVLAALQQVIRQFHSWQDGRPADRDIYDQAEYDETRGLVRATYAVALGSIWHAELAPHAADMRRRRGENVTAARATALSDQIRQNFDPLAAQAFSVCAFGARMLAMALGREDRGAVSEVTDALNQTQ